MSGPTRRELLGSLLGFALVEALWSRELLAAKARPVLGPWFKELAEMTRDLRGRRMLDLEFQDRMEDLYRRVDLAALVELVDLEVLAKRMLLPARGAIGQGVELRGLAGLPAELGFTRQIFACGKGRSIVPHGHNNLVSGFIVLKGRWRGRHYERLETHADHFVIRPTIDRAFGPGDLSTISDHRDNVHWFQAESDTAFIFNVHVSGIDPSQRRSSGRLYLDPGGEPRPDGTIRAPKLSWADCHDKYG